MSDPQTFVCTTAVTTAPAFGDGTGYSLNCNSLASSTYTNFPVLAEELPEFEISPLISLTRSLGEPLPAHLGPPLATQRRILDSPYRLGTPQFSQLRKG